jgi:hypothetical protein
MRRILTAGAILVAASLAPAIVAAEQPACEPNPLTQGHPGWMKMPSTAVDLRAPAPASATNPLLQGHLQILPASPAREEGSRSGNPLTNRP